MLALGLSADFLAQREREREGGVEYRGDETHVDPDTMRLYPTLLAVHEPPLTHSPKTPKTVWEVPEPALRKLIVSHAGGDTEAKSKRTHPAKAKKRPGNAGETILLEVDYYSTVAIAQENIG